MSLSQSPFQISFNDMRSEIIAGISWLLMISGGLAIWRAINLNPMPLDVIAFLTGIVLLAWLTREVSKKRPRIGRYLLIVGLHIGLLLAVIAFDNPLIPFMAVPLIFLNAILIRRGEVVTTMSILLSAILIWHMQGRAYPLPEMALFLGVSVGVAWFVVHTLNTALQWYVTTLDQVEKLLNESRSQRVHLRQALESLEIAYADQKRVQKDLVIARQRAEEAQRLKERFAANISHELRTPLNLIWGFSEMMHFSPEIYGDVNWTPLLTRDIYQIYHSSQHLMEMIDDILDLSYFEQSGFSINLEDTNLNDFMEGVVELGQNLFRDGQAQFTHHIQENLPNVRIDRTRIRQVILNLLNNAKRFTNEGSVSLGVSATSSYVEVKVRDTGIGIGADKLPFIFDEYYQADYSLSRKHGGAGLGLAICRRFVDAHGGSIDVESQTGVGSVFTFHLPVATQFIESLQKPGIALDDNPAHDTTLLVLGFDDRLLNRLERDLAPLQIIPVANEEVLSQYLDEYRPKAIIRNMPPDEFTTARPSVNIPYIRCSLPVQGWLFADLGVQGYLSKPLTMKMLSDFLSSIPPVESMLIIDDNLGFTQMVERYLQVLGHEIRLYRAHNHEQAMANLSQTLPDLILLDVVMPDVNGLDLIGSIRRIPGADLVPVYLLTGTDYQVDSISDTTLSLCVTWPDRRSTGQILTCLRAVVKSLELHSRP